MPTAVDKWGPDHFWPDVNLTFVIVNERNLEQREVYDGALAVQERLASMVKQVWYLITAFDWFSNFMRKLAFKFHLFFHCLT